jgi:Tfp pilus assembly protein PilN
MTTTIGIPAHNERTLRIPTIAANLLPLEIVEARRSRKVHRAVLAALAVFVLGLAGWYVFAAYQTSVARDDLANAQTEAQVLVREQHGYAEVVTTQAQSQAIRGELTALFAGDVNWAGVLDRVRAAAPRGVSVTTLTGAVEGPAVPGTTPTAVPTDPDQVGTLTITGSGPDKASVAAYVDLLAAVPGVANPYLTSATEAKNPTSPENKVQYSIKVEIVRAALNTRFAPKSGKGSGN